MRFMLTFAPNRYPFISSLRWSLLRKPQIGISVKAGGLPNMMEVSNIKIFNLVELVIKIDLDAFYYRKIFRTCSYFYV